MNGDRPGGLSKPPPKDPKGNMQLGVADFFKPSNRTVSENKAAEGGGSKGTRRVFCRDREHRQSRRQQQQQQRRGW